MNKLQFPNNTWKNVSRSRPCIACGKTDWCAFTTNEGAYLCRRVESPDSLRRSDKNGATYFLSLPKLDPTKGSANPDNSPSAEETLESESNTLFRDQIYNELLDRLELTPNHFKALLDRGLSPSQIQTLSYRSFTQSNKIEAAKHLELKYGRRLLDVPGFTTSEKSKQTRFQISLSSGPGLIIPVRDELGRIHGLKIRPERPLDGAKYFYLSSAKVGGPGADATLHFPLTNPTNTETIYVTEGELKSDITSALSGTFTISLPGVSGWRKVIKLCRDSKHTMLNVALDADHQTNAQVARQLGNFCRELYVLNLKFSISIWDPKFKGLDDALKAKAPIQSLESEKVPDYINNLFRRHGLEPLSWEAQQTLQPYNHQPLPGHKRIAMSESWASPTPLPDKSVKLSNLTQDMLPHAMKDWATDVAERMQTPLEYVAVPMLIGAGSLIGRQLAIRPKQFDDWSIIPNLWGVLIGRPSSLKSPALNEALKPLKTIENEYITDYRKELSEWAIKRVAIESQKKGIEEKIKDLSKKGDSGEENSKLCEQLMNLERRLIEGAPKSKRISLNDATVEKTAEILKDNPNGLLIVRDEIYGFLKSNEKHGREGDRAFYLESWNGFGSHIVDRISRGTITVPSVCLSIVGGIQPGRISEYVTQTVSEGSGDDGLLQRFQLMVWPELSRNWTRVDRTPNLSAKIKVELLYRKLTTLKTDQNRSISDDQDSFLRFSAEAQSTFNSWLEKHENRLRSELEDSPAFESHLSKYKKLMPALALIFHVLDSIKDKFNGSSVSDSAASMAIDWCNLLESHARKVYRIPEQTQDDAASQLLGKIQKGKIRDGERIRTIYRHHWRGLTNEFEVNEALATLEQHGWARREDRRETGGAPSPVIRIHPSFIKPERNQ